MAEPMKQVVAYVYLGLGNGFGVLLDTDDLECAVEQLAGNRHIGFPHEIRAALKAVGGGE